MPATGRPHGHTIQGEMSRKFGVVCSCDLLSCVDDEPRMTMGVAAGIEGPRGEPPPAGECGDKVSSLRHITTDTPEHGQDELCSERPGRNGWRSVCVGRRRGRPRPASGVAG